MNQQFSLRSQGLSMAGSKHETNEDAFLCLPDEGLLAVCDGMGGKGLGAKAAATALGRIRAHLAANLDRDGWPMDADGNPQRRQAVRELLGSALQEANTAVHVQTRADWASRGMGTTATVLLVLGRCAFVGHVGHTRVYLLRGQKLHCLTEDHTVLAEIQRRKHGFDEATLKKLPYRTSLTRVLGPQPTVDPDLSDIELLPGDRFLLCSDGLHLHLDDEPGPLVSLLQAGALQDSPQRMIELVRSQGEADDLTAVVAEVLPAQPVTSELTRSLHQRFSFGLQGIGSVALFKHLNDAELFRLLGIAEDCEFSAGETILREGDEGDTMYVLLAGNVSVHVGGRQRAVLGEGSHVGEMALMTRQPRTATIRAETRVLAKRLRRDPLYAVLRENPLLANKVLWNMVSVLSDRLVSAHAAT